MTSLEENIDRLEKEEKDARSKSHMREIEDKWENLVTSIEGRREEIKFLLMRYNCFRLRNLLTLRKKRPAILLGYVNDHQFPMFYSPNQETISFNIGNNIFIHVPKNINEGCWITKTPCIHHAEHVIGKFIGPYKAIIKKK